MFIGHFYFHFCEVPFQLFYFSVMYFASLLIHWSSYAFCTINALSIICLLMSYLTLWFIFSPYLLCFWWTEYLNFHIVESLLWLVFVFYFYKNILLFWRTYIPLYFKSFSHLSIFVICFEVCIMYGTILFCSIWIVRA